MSLRKTTACLALAVAGAWSISATAEQTLPISGCEDIVQNDPRFHDPRNTTARRIGSETFEVTGSVKDSKGRDHRFTCRHEYGEVVSYNVAEAVEGGSSGGGTSNAAAVGAGLIGLAAIAAIAKHDDDNDHRKKRDAYARGDGYALGDKDYLRRECMQEIRYHVDRDHAKVASIDLDAPHLYGRDMSGTGNVYFRNGGSRELRYTCEFDRSGRVYDGRYSFVGAGYPGHSSYSAYDYGGNRNGNSEYRRGYEDGLRGREFDDRRHPQDYKDGYRDGERQRWSR
jgi:hypothetical protein